MSTQENGSLGLTKKSILDRLDTLIELNQKIYDSKILDVESSIPAASVITDIAKTEAEKVKTAILTDLVIKVKDEVTKQIATKEVVDQPQIDKLKLDNKLL